MTRKATAALLTVLVMVALPLFADEKEKGKKEKDKDKAKIEKSEKSEEVEAKEREGEEKEAREVKRANPRRVARINTDVNRLESILVTAQNSAIAFPKPTLTRVANEANSLANRIWADAHKLPNRAVVAAANELRMHVREMHKAAEKGDAAGVRLHAGQALTFATRLDSMV
jgi:hypothetical protein